ncbi:hypothetical protein PG993_003020 [Apiospora rasikravindrae]|uniref:Uncharacterized protein n=1 Tax=Apiospora rasikravindrae TaxID=990691 RepID=A0ABR1U0K1_9PEZI
MADTSGPSAKEKNKVKHYGANNGNSHQLQKYLENSPTTIERLSCSADVKVGTQQHRRVEMSKQLADWQKQWEAASK